MEKGILFYATRQELEWIVVKWARTCKVSGNHSLIEQANYCFADFEERIPWEHVELIEGLRHLFTKEFLNCHKSQ